MMAGAWGRAKAWLRANPGKLTAAGIALLGAFGVALGPPEFADALIAAARVLNGILLGG